MRSGARGGARGWERGGSDRGSGGYSPMLGKRVGDDDDGKFQCSKICLTLTLYATPPLALSENGDYHNRLLPKVESAVT